MSLTARTTLLAPLAIVPNADNPANTGAMNGMIPPVFGTGITRVPTVNARPPRFNFTASFRAASSAMATTLLTSFCFERLTARRALPMTLRRPEPVFALARMMLLTAQANPRSARPASEALYRCHASSASRRSATFRDATSLKRLKAKSCRRQAASRPLMGVSPRRSRVWSRVNGPAKSVAAGQVEFRQGCLVEYRVQDAASGAFTPAIRRRRRLLGCLPRGAPHHRAMARGRGPQCHL